MRCKQGARGLNLRATDIYRYLGCGPHVVEGPSLFLLLALTGRAMAISELHGNGVRSLPGRTTRRPG